jgi:hypothetical protein
MGLFDKFTDDAQTRQREAQDKELRDYTLVGNKGLLNYFKFTVGILLGVWNMHLFITTIPGWEGWFTAFVAINLELMALYCIHNYPRSVGNHKRWLGVFAVICFAFSLTHATFAIISHTGYAAGNAFVEFYSNVIALPLIVTLLSVATAVLTMTHWSAAIIKELAASKISSLSNRARALMKQHQLRDAHELTMLRAKIFDEETRIKEQLVPVIQRRIATKERLEGLIDGIRDDDIRRAIRADLAELDGRTSQAQLPPSDEPPVPQVINGRDQSLSRRRYDSH